jgi:hypothetical protein
MTEKTRTSIHSEDADSFQVLQQSLTNHCNEQKITDALVAGKIDQLMPLAELIPSIQEIVENQRANTVLNKKFAKWARISMTIGGFITALYVIIEFIFKIKE